MEVRGNLDLRAKQAADPPPAKFSGEISKLQNNVLPCTGKELIRYGCASPNIIRRQQYDGKPNVGVSFKFLDNGLPTICLLVQDDRLEIELLEKASRRFCGRCVVTVNNKDFVR